MSTVQAPIPLLQRGPLGWVHARRSNLETRRVADRKDIPRLERYGLGLGGVVAILVLWELLSNHHVINPVLWTSPTGIWDAAYALTKSGQLGTDCRQSGELFIVGFLCATGLGIVGGCALGWYYKVRAIFDPWVSLLYAMPGLALIPLIVVAFGVGFRSQVIVTSMLGFWPVIINVTAGVAATDRGYLVVARSFLATNRDVLKTVALPGALPYIVTAVRQGFSLCLIGVVVAEYFVGNNGLGGLILNGSAVLQTANACVGAFIFSLTALILTVFLRKAERWASKWR